MATATEMTTSEMAILRRIVDRTHSVLSEEAAKAILRLDFDTADRRRMNRLAAKNRAGSLTPAEHDELDNYIHVGQALGIFQARARKSLKSRRAQC